MDYRITDWGEHQHYKNRNPPWIKLHYEILTSRWWVKLDNDSRVLAVACMLIASRSEGVVCDDLEHLQRIAYLNKKPNLKPLIDAGFLTPLNNPPLEDTYKEDTDTETEGQAEDSKREQMLADASTCKRMQADPIKTELQSVIDHLNQISGKHFTLSETAEKNMRKLYDNGKGYTIQQMKEACDKQVSECMGKKEEVYVHPKTIFRNTDNFERILNKPITPDRGIGADGVYREKRAPEDYAF